MTPAALSRLPVETPALVIDLAVMERNLDAMAQLTSEAGVRLRPHTKTHKSPLIARMQLERGAVGIAVAKLGEAEVMVEAGISDILVAYPIVGETKLARLRALLDRADMKVALDSVAVAEGVAHVGRDVGRDIPVYLEVDTGLHRVGLEPGSGLVELAGAVEKLGGLHIIGVMSHAGHVSKATTPEAVAELARADAEDLVEAAEALRAAGFDIREVAPGSTPVAKFSLRVRGVTEFRPGTYLFNDTNTVGRWAATWDECAAAVVATVVSRPAPDRVVIDAGSKVLARDPSVNADVPGFGFVRSHPDLIVDWLSEEHGVCRVREPGDRGGAGGDRGGAGGDRGGAGGAGAALGDGAASGRGRAGRQPVSGQGPAASLRVGDRVEVIPNHICPCVNQFDVAIGVRDGRAVTEIPIVARGKSR